MTSTPAAPSRAAPREAGGGALQVGELELTALPAVIPAEPGYAGARFVLRMHDEPVGRLTIAARDGVLRVAEGVQRAVHGKEGDGLLGFLARRAAERAPAGDDVIGRLWDERTAEAEATTSLSVAVCTRDRPEGVARVLASLESAVPAVEVLVVDNAPSNAATREVTSRFPWARYEVQPEPGLDRARNRALEKATGDIVAFADDDVTVDAMWCHRLRRLFDENPELTLVTGLVEPASLETQAERWFEAYGGFGRGYEPRWIHAPGAATHSIAFAHANSGRYGTGANLAIRRAAALRLGGFDPALDVGTATRGGGDLEMMFRVLKGEGVIGYTPAAMVRHAHRRSWEELASQIESWGSGMVAHLRRTARAHPDERAAVAALRGWLYGTWFAKRLLTSYLYAPFPRELIELELRGSFRGSELYAEASRGQPAPRPTPSLRHRIPSGVTRTLRAEHSLGVDRGAFRLGDGGDARVALHVQAGSRALGVLEMQSVGGVIGGTRLRDAVAARWRRELLGGDLALARRRLSALIGMGVRG